MRCVFRGVEERNTLERHTVELVEVRQFASRVDTLVQFSLQLRQLALQPGKQQTRGVQHDEGAFALLADATDLQSAVQTIYSSLPKMMRAEGIRLHIRLGEAYITDPFTAEEQRLDKLRSSITGNRALGFLNVPNTASMIAHGLAQHPVSRLARSWCMIRSVLQRSIRPRLIGCPALMGWHVHSSRSRRRTMLLLPC